jgi:GTPase SAR1 family protein
MSNSLEAKIVVLGSQGVGKTSLVHRYVKNAFTPPTTQSTVGASFLTKRVVDIDTSTVVRLQIWDTAGQERFRSISKLYYRGTFSHSHTQTIQIIFQDILEHLKLTTLKGANAAVLCYDITDPQSFEEMGSWFRELKTNLGDDIILHVVGTKSDIVAEDPSTRKVPFERCIAYVADNLSPAHTGQPHNTQASGWGSAFQNGGMASPQSNRSSGFWGQDLGWDCCHEISAKDGEGVDEVFRVITRKLVEQQQKKFEEEQRQLLMAGATPVVDNNGNSNGYFDFPGAGNGSFRLGVGDKRRSWMGFPTTPGVGGVQQGWEEDVNRVQKKKGGRCC